MAGWTEAQKVREETKGGGEYVSLKDGEHEEVIVGEKLHIYREVWLVGENRSEDYDPVKHDGMKPRTKFLVPMLVRDGAKNYTPSVFDASGQAFDSLKEAVEEYGLDTVYKLKRNGSGTDTKYSLLFKRKLEGDEAEFVAEIEQLDPEEIHSGRSGAGSAEAADLPDSGTPEGWGDAPF